MLLYIYIYIYIYNWIVSVLIGVNIGDDGNDGTKIAGPERVKVLFLTYLIFIYVFHV